MTFARGSGCRWDCASLRVRQCQLQPRRAVGGIVGKHPFKEGAVEREDLVDALRHIVTLRRQQDFLAPQVHPGTPGGDEPLPPVCLIPACRESAARQADAAGPRGREKAPDAAYGYRWKPLGGPGRAFPDWAAGGAAGGVSSLTQTADFAA